jgi:hypothetical protein
VRGSSQALLARLLTGCGIEAFGDVQARAVGALAARAATDIVDACVVEGAMRRHDLGVSSDEGDLQAIAVRPTLCAPSLSEPDSAGSGFGASSWTRAANFGDATRR